MNTSTAGKFFGTPHGSVSTKQAVIQSASPVKSTRRGPTLRVLSIQEGEAITLVDLFVLKCRLCKVIFSMNDNDGNFEAKEIKRNTLLELIQLMDGETSSDSGMT